MKILCSLQVVFIVTWITPILENSKKKSMCKKKMKCELYKYNYSNSIHR